MGKNSRIPVFLTAAAACAALLFSAGNSYSSVSDVQESLNQGTINQSATPAAAGAQADTAGKGQQSSSGVVMADVLNVRSGPWGDIMGTVKSGAKLEILGKEGEWYKVKYDGKDAFVHSAYVATESAPASASDGYVNTQGSTLNVRTGPWGDIIGSLTDGTALEILGKKGDWLIIKYNGKEAYVHSDYISDKPVAAAKPASSNNQQVSSGSGDFGGRPVQGGPVTSEFGPRDLFGNSYHYGIDIGVPTGTPLASLGKGRVVSAGWDYGGGNTIVIKYDNGYTSTYCHCQNMSVSAGDTVSKGQTVGHTNNTGAWTTGPHLHFAITNPSGQKINPRNAPGITI